MALRAGTALIGFGQAAEATGHEDPVRKFANNLGVSNKVYDTASEAIPFLTALGCMGAPAVLQYSALKSGASAAVDAVANISEHATEAEERVISYETDVYSVYTKGSYNKAPKPNYGPFETNMHGDNRGAALKGLSNPKTPIKQNEVTSYKDFVDRSVVGDNLEGHEIWQHANLKANGLATNRLSTEASKNNPVIAVNRQLHKKINKAQRELDAANQLPIDNIMSNSKILRDNGISSDIVDDITNRALSHMKSTLK